MGPILAHWTYGELFDAIKNTSCYKNRPNSEIQYEVGELHVSLRRRVGGPTCFDHELARRLHHEPRVLVRVRPGRSGTILAHGLRWHGGQRVVGRLVEVEFRYGRFAEARIISEQFFDRYGRAKVEEFLCRGKPPATGLTLGELLCLAASSRRRACRTREANIRFQEEKFRYVLPANGASLTRTDFHILRLLRKADFTLSGKAIPWRILSMLGISAPRAIRDLSHLGKRSLRLKFKAGRLVRREIYSAQFKDSDGKPKLEEVCDLRTGKIETRLAIAELISMLPPPSRWRKTTRSAIVKAEGGVFRVAVPGACACRSERLLQAALMSRKRISVRSTCSKAGLFSVYGLVWHGQTARAGREVEVLFSHAKPFMVKVFSPRLRSESIPSEFKCEEIINLSSGRARTELSARELLRELESSYQQGARSDDRSLVVSIDGEMFRVPQRDQRNHRFSELLGDALKRHPQIFLLGPVSNAGFVGRFGLRWETNGSRIGGLVQVAFRFGIPSRIEVYSPEGVLTELLERRGKHSRLVSLWRRDVPPRAQPRLVPIAST